MNGDLSGPGALLGLVAGLGAWLLVSRVPWHRSPTLDQRLYPYLRGICADQLMPVPIAGPRTPLDVVERVLGPFMTDAVHVVERISGGPGTVRRRLDQLGGRRSVDQFRAEQVLCGVLGAAVGLGIGALTTIGRGLNAVPLIGLVVVGALLGVLGRDQA